MLGGHSFWATSVMNDPLPKGRKSLCRIEIEIEIEIVYFYSHHMKLTGLDFRT